MFPGFETRKRIENLTLTKGERVNVDYPAEFFGKIEIKNGSSLSIEHTSVVFHSWLHVNGGRISMKDSKILIEDCAEKSFINIEETTLCDIENSEIDCKGKTGFLCQKQGNLQIIHTIIEDTAGQSAVVFLGNHIYIEGTSFLHCQSGAIQNDAKIGMDLKKCQFSYCNNEHGGAVYSQSISDSRIEQCSFYHCIAKYLGGAVYFQNRKYGQWVKNCKIEECAPKDSCIFNEYAYEMR